MSYNDDDESLSNAIALALYVIRELEDSPADPVDIFTSEPLLGYREVELESHRAILDELLRRAALRGVPTPPVPAYVPGSPDKPRGIHGAMLDWGKDYES